MAAIKDVKVLLRQMGDGSESAPEQLLPLVYDELRKSARDGRKWKNTTN